MKSLLTIPALALVFALAFTGCSGASKTTEAENEETAEKTDDAAFYETQPLHSGLYDATYYDITGPGARKGSFDGRIYFSLSPATSAMYVFENGNRTKIDNLVVLSHPFEKNDSNVYTTVDSKNNPVTLLTDSTSYCVKYVHAADTMQITFNSKPRHEGTAIEILEKINEQRNKK